MKSLAEATDIVPLDSSLLLFPLAPHCYRTKPIVGLWRLTVHIFFREPLMGSLLEFQVSG